VEWEKVYRDLKKRNWIILLLLSTISTFLMNHTVTLGVILGGLIIIANFSVLQHTIRRAFPSEKVVKTKKSILIIKGYFRLLALGVVIYFTLKWDMVDPIGLTVGLSTVVFSIVSLGISRAFKILTGEAT
jgi:uncharacterized membrane protein